MFRRSFLAYLIALSLADRTSIAHQAATTLDGFAVGGMDISDTQIHYSLLVCGAHRPAKIILSSVPAELALAGVELSPGNCRKNFLPDRRFV